METNYLKAIRIVRKTVLMHDLEKYQSKILPYECTLRNIIAFNNFRFVIYYDIGVIFFNMF